MKLQNLCNDFQKQHCSLTAQIEQIQKVTQVIDLSHKLEKKTSTFHYDGKHLTLGAMLPPSGN